MATGTTIDARRSVSGWGAAVALTGHLVVTSGAGVDDSDGWRPPRTPVVLRANDEFASVPSVASGSVFAASDFALGGEVGVDDSYVEHGVVVANVHASGSVFAADFTLGGEEGEDDSYVEHDVIIANVQPPTFRRRARVRQVVTQVDYCGPTVEFIGDDEA